MGWEATGITQTRDDGGLGNGLAVRMDLGCVLDLEPTRLADGLDVSVQELA